MKDKTGKNIPLLTINGSYLYNYNPRNHQSKSNPVMLLALCLYVKFELTGYTVVRLLLTVAIGMYSLALP